MAIGFLIPSLGSPEGQITPDKSLAASSTPRVLTAKFGDGYEQRLADGINTLEQQYSITFANRTKQEIDDITAYFASLKGVTAFDYVIADSNVSPVYETTIKVVCQKWNQVYVNNDCYTCTATFKRVYEA